MAAPKSIKGKVEGTPALADPLAPPPAAAPAPPTVASPDMVPAKPKAEAAPVPAKVSGDEAPSAFVTVTSAHGILSHDGTEYKPGEPVTMRREHAAALGGRVKPVK